MNQVSILLYRDGNEFCALLGDNIQDGKAGFGRTIPAALRNLANELEDENALTEIEACL
jgi:hypothetical protein